MSVTSSSLGIRLASTLSHRRVALCEVVVLESALCATTRVQMYSTSNACCGVAFTQDLGALECRQNEVRMPSSRSIVVVVVRGHDS